MSPESLKGSSPTWTVLQALQWTSAFFQRKEVDSPRLTAEILLGHALGCPRIRLYTDFERPLVEAERAAYRALIQRRVEGVPTFYLVGIREFYGRPFRVDARVLIPRPETERLVELVIARMGAGAAPRIADLCTGSGAIALTLAAELPASRVWGTDASSDALAIARENRDLLGLQDRVELALGDLFQPLPSGAQFDAIVANPPYIAEGCWEQLPREVRAEPRIALLAGPDGLEFLRRISSQAHARLVPGGWVALELGDDQGPHVRNLLIADGFESVTVERDFAGKDRVALGRRAA